MIRKILLLVTLMVAMFLPMAMNAQLLSNQDLKMHRAPYALKSLNHQMMAPARVNLGENQMVMGHYDTDEVASSNDGQGFTSLPGVISIGTIITPAELAVFQGGEIVKFRVGLAQSTAISRVFVIPVTNGDYGQTTEWSCSVRAAGWNEITLETPYKICLGSNTSLMIGFDYQQTTSKRPISTVEVGDIYPSYIYYQGSWQNIGLSPNGNLSVQCIVESENFPDYLIKVGNLMTKSYSKLGDDLQFGFVTKNSGVAADAVAAGVCSYNVLVDDVLITTIANHNAFGRDFVQVYDAIPTTGLSPGKHTLTIEVATINGEPVEEPTSTSRDLILYEYGFPHQKHVLEEFTTTNATYDPLGNSLLDILTSMRDDIALVGIHCNFNGADPMNTRQCDSIMNYQGCGMFPSGSFNRSVGWDSNQTIVNGLGFSEEYHQDIAENISGFYDNLAEMPSFSNININSTLDTDTRQAVITVSGELTPDFDEMMGADSKLTVYITEDGVVAPQYMLGTWVSDYVHNNVLRMALNSVKGQDLNRNGSTYENMFTCTIPSDWNIDNLNVVAFISRPITSGDFTDMYVNQANKCKLGNANEPLSDYDFIVDGIYYHIIENNAVMVVYAESYLDDIVIPETVCYQGTTYDVTSIGGFAFYGCSPLSSLTVPVNVTSISTNAFVGSGVEVICITGNGEWQAGALPSTVKTLYIGSGVSSIAGLKVNPTTIYNYSTTPSLCNELTFTGYSGTLHVPTASVVAYFIADYWCNFADIIDDAVEPESITMSQDSLSLSINGQKRINASISPSDATPSTISWQSSNKAIATVENGQVKGISKGECDIVATCVGKQAICHVNVIEVLPTSLTLNLDYATMEVGDQIHLIATVLPEDATNVSVSWLSTDGAVATVDNGVVTAVAPGECDVIARCGDLSDTCHVTIVERIIYITLDEHEVSVLPNHIISLTPTMTPEATDLKVTSSDPSVAAVRLVNNKVQVVGIKEGETTISVESVDGTAVGDTCHVTVYTEVGDVNSDGYVKINDVTALVDYLLSGDTSTVNVSKADTNMDGKISIADVTSLISYLLSGSWPWEEIEVTDISGQRIGKTIATNTLDLDTFYILV